MRLEDIILKRGTLSRYLSFGTLDLDHFLFLALSAF